jgi:Lar family restriction alleviation protein
VFTGIEIPFSQERSIIVHATASVGTGKGMRIEPCPFCGGRHVQLAPYGEDTVEGIPVWMECRDCGAAGPKDFVAGRAFARTVALQNWNRRAE